ncbi:ABC transporter permease [Roseivivax halodurans JCM 10272]|uniref:ABC transporter permease n=1 Tax=Roseivivax halodurans JCM 10272 TaxID=1449350 RepID=X7E9Z5_9RHOB|nr:iron ABC transporter permease [Roseivivax halodurans]ETX12777.1 ABC transporter permease [Roseivivax halodurans JCM 10272]
MTEAASLPLAARIAAGRRARTRSRRRIAGLLAAVLAAGGALTLMVGQSVTPAMDVMRVLAGQDVPGAGFTIRELRLPRAVLAVLAGMSFGLGGVVFQTMLRNPLASPDIIGISSGASAAAVVAIVVLGWSGAAVSGVAIIAGLVVAAAIYLLALKDGLSGARMILVGIGISAMLDSLIAYVLLGAPSWTLQDALRWLTGSTNGVTLDQAVPISCALLVFGGLLIGLRRNLDAMRLGDDAAAALGVRLTRDRALIVLSAVGLIAVATAVTGPIAFIAFLSGPIATAIAGPGRPALMPAALVGAMLVLVGDYAGQHLLPARVPVGVVTGAIGAPYLLYLIVRSHGQGGR